MNRKLWKRLAAGLLCLCMSFPLLPVSAKAAGFDDTAMTTLDLSAGPIVIEDSGVTSGAVSGVPAALDPNGYRITGTNGRNPYNIRITADTTIELDGVTLNTSGLYKGNSPYNTYAILISGGANVTIYVKGTNTITAAGRFAGITVADDSSVTIKCPDHSDLPDGDPLKGKCRDTNAACDPADGANPACSNILNVKGAPQIDGEIEDLGDITTSYDTSASAPGIGGITGFGGAVGETDMAALGFDTTAGTSGGTINIEGGVLRAESATGHGACIGSGVGAPSAGTINISGGLVRAYGKGTGAGIGGGVGSAGGEITISGNAYVDADGGSGGAGIGGGGSTNWDITGIPTIHDPGAGGTIRILDHAVVEAAGGGTAGSVNGAAAGIGPGGKHFEQINGYDTAGAVVSIDKGTHVYAWSRGELPAITTVDGINHSDHPADVLNHRIREPIGTGVYVSLSVFPQADDEGAPDFSSSGEPTYAQEQFPSKGVKNFGYTVEQSDFYSEKVSINGGNFTPMRHAEDALNPYFSTTGLTHQDILFYVSNVQVDDVTVNYGESGTLTAKLLLLDEETNPAVSYRWEIKKDSSGFQPITGAEQSTYTYTPTDVTENNTGYPVFHCIVTQQDGTELTSNEARVYARGLDLTITPKDVMLDFGAALPDVSAIPVQYDGFINADTVENTKYLTGVLEIWGVTLPVTEDVKDVTLEFQTDEGTPITTTSGLEAGMYNVVVKLPDAQAAEELCRQYANYYLKLQNGKLYYGVKPVTVTFKVANGTWADGTAADKTVTVLLKDGKGTLSTSDVPTGMIANSGYEGGAWDAAPNTAADAITGNVTYTYRFTKQSGGGGGGGTTYYTLDYETNGGSKIASERHASGTVVKLTKIPTREGYTFSGWYADKELTDNITEIKMSGNKTVYAGWKATGVPDGLNGDDHFAYINGYPDGFVRPTADITRAEVAAIFYRLLKDEVRAANETASNSFSDVETAAWYNREVSTIAKLGVVEGYRDGTFRPDAPITRAEFATIAARFDSNTYTGADRFPDIAGHWAAGYINRAAQMGWVQGDANGNYRPDAQITRAEAVTLINRVLQRLPETKDDLLDGMKMWPDNADVSKWYYLPVQEATNGHDYERKTDGVHEKWTSLAP